MQNDDFWHKLDQCMATNTVSIDRPKGSVHPCYPSFRYPLGYGYLAGTRSGDGDRITVWAGSLLSQTVTGIIRTVDLQKRDSEMKILLGCTSEEAQQILEIHNAGSQAAVLIDRPQ